MAPAASASATHDQVDADESERITAQDVEEEEEEAPQQDGVDNLFAKAAKMLAWQPKFEQLREYKETHGHCRVPGRYKENQPLARWVKTVRAEYKKFSQGKQSFLIQEHITKLNDLGFEWELRSGGRSWETNMEELKEYKEVHGNCLVPMKYEENQALASWVKSTRQAYKKLQNGETSSLTRRQIADLNKIGFEWELRSGRRQSETVTKWIPWENRMEELKAYKEAHGDCCVPIKWKENQSLATWVYNTKYQYGKLQNGEETPLTPERVAELDAIGFDWEIPGGFRAGRSEPKKMIFWETRMGDLKQYKKENGHCRVPRNSKEHRELGIWVSNTRQEYAKLQKGEKSSLTQQRMAELNILGFDWTPYGGRKTATSSKKEPDRGTKKARKRKGRERVADTESQPSAPKRRTSRRKRR